ncbi:MAG: CAAD domain-containing protein [Cyanobacteria bacterium P01_F01_bin.153]
MEPELQKSEYADAGTNAKAEMTTSTPSLSSANGEDSPEWQQILEQFYKILSDLPDYVGKFYGEYRQPIVTAGLIVAAFISVKLVVALLGAINEVPLLSPIFELVGLTYSGWFVYRYLLRVSSRKELSSKVGDLKDQVIGNKSSD